MDAMEQLAELKREIESLKSAGPAPASAPPQSPQQQPESYTWEQVQEAVDNGQMTQAQAHNLWAEQTERRAREAAKEDAESSRKAEKIASQLDAEIARYHDRVPELKNVESDQLKRVKAEFDRLVGLGFEPTKYTELTALGRIYGSAEAIARKSEKQPKTETHQEGASGRDEGGETVDDDEDTPPGDLNSGEKRYYADLISKGIYDDWSEVRAERKEVSELKKKRKRRG